MVNMYKDSETTNRPSFLPQILVSDESSPSDRNGERTFRDDVSASALVRRHSIVSSASLSSLNDDRRQLTHKKQRHFSMPETRMKSILESRDASPDKNSDVSVTSQKTMYISKCPCAQRPLQLSVFQRERRCVCTCKPGAHWNTSTKPTTRLPKLNITKTGNLAYNRDFCYRVINPRAVIEEAILKRRGFCATRVNNNHSNRKKVAPPPPKKVSGDKYTIYDDNDNIKVISCEASEEFKATICDDELADSL